MKIKQNRIPRSKLLILKTLNNVILPSKTRKKLANESNEFQNQSEYFVL